MGQLKKILLDISSKSYLLLIILIFSVVRTDGQKNNSNTLITTAVFKVDRDLTCKIYLDNNVNVPVFLKGAAVTNALIEQSNNILKLPIFSPFGTKWTSVYMGKFCVAIKGKSFNFSNFYVVDSFRDYKSFDCVIGGTTLLSNQIILIDFSADFFKFLDDNNLDSILIKDDYEEIRSKFDGKFNIYEVLVEVKIGDIPHFANLDLGYHGGVLIPYKLFKKKFKLLNDSNPYVDTFFTVTGKTNVDCLLRNNIDVGLGNAIFKQNVIGAKKMEYENLILGVEYLKKLKSIILDYRYKRVYIQTQSSLNLDVEP